MSNLVLVDLFVEDYAQEALLRPLIERIGKEEGFQVHVRVRSAKGGAPHALREFQGYQRLLERYTDQPPHILVVARDGDCRRFFERREEVRERTSPAWQDRLVVACPEPHIERWYLSDAEAFQRALGSPPPVPAPHRRCRRATYKAALEQAVRAAGYPPTLHGVEHAQAIAEALDLRQPRDRSLKAFVEDLRAALRHVARLSGGAIP